MRILISESGNPAARNRFAIASTAGVTAPTESVELISINTTDSVGAVTPAVEAMAKRFRAAGFPDSDIKILIPPGKPTKGNLVVRYHRRGGPNAAKPILLLAHLDVVAALRSDWPRDPFTLNEENGYFLGRGTADDKAMASMFVANLLRYKQE